MTPRDHGGGLDAAIRQYGGTRQTWLDLSTGINPVPYPVSTFPPDAWTALPDSAAFDTLETAARSIWNIPDTAAVLAAPGASSLIARLPHVLNGSTFDISLPTYNEHAAAFNAAGWMGSTTNADAKIRVHPNNPDGREWLPEDFTTRYTIIDESFCDVTPDRSHVAKSAEPNTIILKSFGKFWGLAGLRLGFAIGDPTIINALKATLGPWQISGPALSIGANALNDNDWAQETLHRLSIDAAKLDRLLEDVGAKTIGGTTLFRLYEVDNAATWQRHLAQSHVWSRIFPYSENWIRLGLPSPDRWQHLKDAL